MAPPRSVLQVTPSNQLILQCPICYEIPSGRIFQCVNGHTICSNCCPRVRECPFCKVSFWTETPGDGTKKRIRALGMESMLDAMTFECPNKTLGCQAIMKRDAIGHHLKNDCIHEPRENRNDDDEEQETVEDIGAHQQEQEIYEQLGANVQQQRNFEWARTCGAGVFLITGLCFIGLFIIASATGQEVQWVIITLYGRSIKLGM